MPKTVIFANGVPSGGPTDRRHISPADTIICADGGARHALALGLTPHLIVGDFDSLPAETLVALQAGGVKTRRYPAHKDQTDLELALAAAVEQGATEILILTALGGRLDQQLANIMLLTRPEWAGVRLRLAEGNQHAWLLRGPDSLTLRAAPGDTLSLVALSHTLTGLSLSGVQWPLRRATVRLGSTLTVSNVFVEPEAAVRLESGLALAVVIKTQPNVKQEAQ